MNLGLMLQSMMAWAESSQPAIHALSTVAGAAGRVQQGRQARAISEAEARQFEARAKSSRAIGSLQAQRLMKANERLRGRANAVLAASGFSASDTGSQAIVGEMAREGSIQEMLLVAQAEQEAQNDQFRAKLRRSQGRGAQAAYNMEAAAALVTGTTSWRERFGSPDPGDDDEGSGPGGAPYSYNDPDPDPYHRNP